MSHIVLRSFLRLSFNQPRSSFNTKGLGHTASSKGVLLALGFLLLASGCSLTPVEQAAAPIVGGEARATPGSIARPDQTSQEPARSSEVSGQDDSSGQTAASQAGPGPQIQEGQVIKGVAEPARPVIDPNRQASLGRSIGQFQALGFDQLEGWKEDRLEDALLAWRRNCEAMMIKGQPFVRLCEESNRIDPNEHAAVRRFFETQFEPRRLVTAGPSGRNQNTITGYYEPVLKGSRTPSEVYKVPLYKTPADLVTVKLDKQYPALQSYRLRGRLVQTEAGAEIQPYPSRAELDTQGLLKGYEIAWVTDPIEAFFLQIQGSGKIKLEDGSYMRLGYANQNGHPYVSIGRWLVSQGELTLAQASMQGIQAWLNRNPQRQNELLHQNPSVVFFRELPPTNDPTEGPLGSLGVPLTAGRSLAVDPRYVALGLPVVLSTRLPGESGQKPQAVTRLVFAQDTGSAIQGPHRGDFFFGSGFEAGQRAGRMKYDGEMVVLIPKGLQGY